MMALNEIEEHLELQANSQNEKHILASIILIAEEHNGSAYIDYICLLYTSPSPRDA